MLLSSAFQVMRECSSLHIHLYYFNATIYIEKKRETKNQNREKNTIFFCSILLLNKKENGKIEMEIVVEEIF